MISVTIPKAPSKSIHDLHREHEDIVVEFEDGDQYALVSPSWYQVRPVLTKTLESAAEHCFNTVVEGYPAPTVFKRDGTQLEYIQRQASEPGVAEEDGKLIDHYIDLGEVEFSGGSDALKSRVLL